MNTPDRREAEALEPGDDLTRVPLAQSDGRGWRLAGWLRWLLRRA